MSKLLSVRSYTDESVSFIMSKGTRKTECLGSDKQTSGWL